MTYNLQYKTFGRLIAFDFIYENNIRKWKCICSCGNKVNIITADLINGHSKSCGCYSADLVAHRNLKHGSSVRGKITKEYRAWCEMHKRCKSDKNYAGRGIKVCDRWKSFKKFFEDIGKAPSTSLSLDRIDNNKGYSPSNCKWSTRKEQIRNRRSTVTIKYNRKIYTLAELAELYSLKYMTLFARIFKFKWPIKKALTTPLKTLD